MQDWMSRSVELFVYKEKFLQFIWKNLRIHKDTSVSKEQRDMIGMMFREGGIVQQVSFEREFLSLQLEKKFVEVIAGTTKLEIQHERGVRCIFEVIINCLDLCVNELNDSSSKNNYVYHCAELVQSVFIEFPLMYSSLQSTQKEKMYFIAKMLSFTGISSLT